eukprot:760497-Prymnesium_polylepis.3
MSGVKPRIDDHTVARSSESLVMVIFGRLRLLRRLFRRWPARASDIVGVGGNAGRGLGVGTAVEHQKRRGERMQVSRCQTNQALAHELGNQVRERNMLFKLALVLACAAAAPPAQADPLGCHKKTDK